MKHLNSAMIIAAGIFWGTMGLFVHALTGLYGFTTIQSACLRITGAAIMLCIFLFFYDKSKFKIALRDIWMFLCTGIFSVLCLTVFYFLSINSGTSMSVSAILLYTSPIFVMVTSCVIFHEKFTRRKLLALVFAFAGCVLVSMGNGAQVTAKGIIYGILAGVSYASYSIFGTIALRKYHPFTVTTYSFVVAAIGSLIIGNVPGIVSNISNIHISAGLVFLILGAGFVTAFAPFLLYTKGLSGTEPGKAAIMASVEPMMATICGLFQGEKITLPIVFGIVGILGAIVILNTGKKEANI